MPGGDGTGPRGKGPGTGRGLGRKADNPKGGTEIGRRMGLGGGTGIGKNIFPVNQMQTEKPNIQNSQSKAVVNKEKCIACEICIPACPFEAITMKEKAQINIAKCTGCGECVSICPTNAISLR